MNAISRREFFRKTAADAAIAGFVAAGVTRLSANPLGLPIGSQTYPHRQMIVDGKFPELLKTLKDIGVERIELCSPGYKEFSSLSDGKQTAKIIADHGLKCESAHFPMRDLRENQEKSIAWAKDIGMTQMITATLGMPPDKALVTMDYAKRAADEYNKIGAVAAKAGIQQGLHNEGFENSVLDGRKVYDIMLELLDPKLVKMQFQMSSIRVVGDPVEYFKKYPGRFISLHLQDVDLTEPAPAPPSAPAAGGQPAGGQAPGGQGGGGRGRGQRPVGKGSIDWVKTFQAAKIGGVKNYFVEQNMELTKESVAFLKTLKA
jgi:sugar phosphate isomerase/epimerase